MADRTRQSHQVVKIFIKRSLVPRARVQGMIKKASSNSEYQNQRTEQKPKGPCSTHICVLVWYT